ncbi:MAG: NAD-dependent epimerase/dehydratase family protein, partial [Planctomycetota bacterium]
MTRRVLVTGCSGFLGGEIVRQCLARGDDAVGLSRRLTPDLVHLGMAHHRGDLLDTSYLKRVIHDVDVVVHTAAVAGIWGPSQFFFDNNVVASRNVIDACRHAGVSQLIFTSSPSVTFDGNDQSGIDEAAASYPDRWMCEYPRTKAIAEQEVLAANDKAGLRTVALRPHLIWGPGDPHLLPRILERA